MANEGEEGTTPQPQQTPQLQLPSKSALGLNDRKSNNKSAGAASKNNLKGI